MSDPIRLFVGYDPDEALASAVFIHSAERRASARLQVEQLRLARLKGVFDRPREALQSTEFAFSRFLVPYLCGYQGWALFADGDMICRADLAELWALRDVNRAVQVVQRQAHGMTPDGLKFLGRAQSAYPRKNWSSVVLFNNARCRRLDPAYVATAPGLELHQFAWLPDHEIGELPAAWNHLVGVDAPDPAAKLVHFTLGMPFFHGWRECEYAPEWRAERDAMLAHAREDDECRLGNFAGA